MAKRSNIRRRGRSWVVYFRIRDPERGSVQVQKSFADRDHPGGRETALEAAKLHLAQSQAEVIRGEFRRPAKITFREFAAEWLRDYALTHVSPATFTGYEGALRNHLV